MNQSNKALRDEVAEFLEEIVNREHLYHTTNYDGVVGVTPEDSAHLIALVTNHIKGLDCMQTPKGHIPDEECCDACDVRQTTN